MSKELWIVVSDSPRQGVYGQIHRSVENARSDLAECETTSGYDNARCWHYISNENGTRVEEWVEPKNKYFVVRDHGDLGVARMPNMPKDLGVYEYIPGKDMRLLSDAEVEKLRADL